MPAPLDLTGRRFGRLQVLAREGTVKWGREQSAWRCQCDCGRQEVLPLDKLVKRGVIECAICRQRSCVVCGNPVPLDRGWKDTCSAACLADKTRASQAAHYYRRVERDPDHNIKHHARQAELIAADPARAAAAAAKVRARSVARWQEIKADPALREAQRLRSNGWYAANAQRIQAERSARIAALDDAAFGRWAARARAYGRAYRKKWRAELVADPAQHRKYLDLQREYRRQSALRKLMATGQTLIERSKT